MSQTRRLAAILAADVAGYSRLMGASGILLFCAGHYIRLANRSETALLVENAMTIFDSRLFPVTPSIFPVRRQIIPDYALTGIPGQAVDASALFSRPNGRPKAKSTKFPVIFPVHGNFP